MKISAKHWNVEALFIKTYLPEYVSLFAEIETIDTIGSLDEFITTKTVAFFLEKYHEVKMQNLKGNLGAATLVWLKYINIIVNLNQLQYAVYANNSLWNWWFVKSVMDQTKSIRPVTTHIIR